MRGANDFLRHNHGVAGVHRGAQQIAAPPGSCASPANHQTAGANDVDLFLICQICGSARAPQIPFRTLAGHKRQCRGVVNLPVDQDKAGLPGNSDDIACPDLDVVGGVLPVLDIAGYLDD